MNTVTTLEPTTLSYRVLAFEHALERWCAVYGQEVPRILREADHLRLELGPWATPTLVGRVTYREIEDALDCWRLVAEVAEGAIDGHWWRACGGPGRSLQPLDGARP